MASNEDLPDGVRTQLLTPHADDRGIFTEIFREEWSTGCAAVQWNAVHSVAGVLRGVHVHATHHDYLVVLSGVMVLGLHDIRPSSPTRGCSRLLTLDASAPRAITIPPGVCHGFYFPVASLHVYAVSAYWNPQDELGCQFDCRELELAWPTDTPRLSARDRMAGSYLQMCESYRARHDALAPGASR